MTVEKQNWRNFGIPKKIQQVFETGGRPYLALLYDRFITETNKICFSVTPGLIVTVVQHGHQGLWHLNLWGMAANHLYSEY